MSIVKPGEQIEKYRIISRLGEGGMGEVFLAEHTSIGRQVAIKILRADYAGKNEAVTRFIQEARAVNKIGHAMHDLDPVFSAFSRQPRLAKLAGGLFRDPLLLQSMYIFKQPGIGGEVSWHQDSTYLYTDPMSCIGFWFALEDADATNGGMLAMPGAHRGRVPIAHCD